MILTLLKPRACFQKFKVQNMGQIIINYLFKPLAKKHWKYCKMFSYNWTQLKISTFNKFKMMGFIKRKITNEPNIPLVLFATVLWLWTVPTASGLLIAFHTPTSLSLEPFRTVMQGKNQATFPLKAALSDSSSTLRGLFRGLILSNHSVACWPLPPSRCCSFIHSIRIYFASTMH